MTSPKKVTAIVALMALLVGFAVPEARADDPDPDSWTLVIGYVVISTGTTATATFSFTSLDDVFATLQDFHSSTSYLVWGIQVSANWSAPVAGGIASMVIFAMVVDVDLPTGDDAYIAMSKKMGLTQQQAQQELTQYNQGVAAAQNDWSEYWKKFWCNTTFGWGYGCP